MGNCEICDGIGLIKTERGSQPCPCQLEAERKIRVNRMGLPPAFGAATLAGFKPSPHTRNALELARAYVRDYIPGQTKTGLLFTGSTGTGKTHLAVGAARQLAEEKGVDARFVDMTDFLDRMRIATFDNNPPETKTDILRPIHAAELVILDELGGARSNDWVFEVVENLIGRLYNDQKPVLVTSNAPNQQYDPKATQPTLGERIGQRMYSRLQQVCLAADMTGPDWRMRKQWQ